jgi:hypothetical protein
VSGALCRALAVLGIALVLGACATRVPTPQVPVPSAAAAEQAWARVLQTHVNAQGEVDFAALAAQPHDLQLVVRHIADTPPAALPQGPAKLAYLINAYNALSMFNVLQSGIPKTHAGLNKLRFFVLRELDIGGQPMSLYAFENDVIRPYARSLDDPRVHFALNCSAVSCPVLPRTPFTAAALDAQLERETRAFFAQPRNWRIDTQTRTLWLSEILDFYTEDFVPRPAASLLDYANRYAPRSAPAGYTVRFTPYDWTVADSNRRR